MTCRAEAREWFTLNKAEMASGSRRSARAGLRQWQLAEMLGMTQSAVHKYEHRVIPSRAGS
jgi:predicted transcriptional regulator